MRLSLSDCLVGSKSSSMACDGLPLHDESSRSETENEHCMVVMYKIACPF